MAVDGQRMTAENFLEDELSTVGHDIIAIVLKRGQGGCAFGFERLLFKGGSKQCIAQKLESKVHVARQDFQGETKAVVTGELVETASDGFDGSRTFFGTAFGGVLRKQRGHKIGGAPQISGFVKRAPEPNHRRAKIGYV